MRKIAAALAMVGLCVSQQALAENLIRYSTDRTGTVLYYDADTIRHSSGYVLVWTLFDASKDKSVKYNTVRALWKIDCSSMSSGAMAVAKYKANGELLDSGSFDYPHITPDVPGSVGYKLDKVICDR